MFEEIEKHDTVMCVVFKYVNDNNSEGKSKDSRDKLDTSSARMVAILKNLQKKGLIIEINSKLDARAISIKISAKGKEVVDKIEKNFRITVEKIVDEFGIEHVSRLFEDMAKIKEIIKNSMKSCEGGKNV